MLIRAMQAALITCMFTLILAPAAMAQDYPISGGDVILVDDPERGLAVFDDGTVAALPGATIEFVAGGFEASSEVTITLESDPVTLGTATADVNGNIEVTVEVPDSFEVGQHTLKATGTAADGGLQISSKSMLVLSQADFEAAQAAGTADGTTGSDPEAQQPETDDTTIAAPTPVSNPVSGVPGSSVGAGQATQLPNTGLEAPELTALAFAMLLAGATLNTVAPAGRTRYVLPAPVRQHMRMRRRRSLVVPITALDALADSTHE